MCKLDLISIALPFEKTRRINNFLGDFGYNRQFRLNVEAEFMPRHISVRDLWRQGNALSLQLKILFKNLLAI